MSDIKLIKGDAYELIKSIPDKSIDLIYTDIPYIVNKSGKGCLAYKVEKLKDDLTNNVDITSGIDYSILEEFCRVLKHIYIYIWCSEKQLLDIMNYFNNKGCFINLLTWKKTNPIPLGNLPFLSDLEYCLCVHEKGCKFAMGYQHKSKCFISPINKADKDLFDHPTIKPLEFVENHLLNSSNEGDTILDPFMGSGTTGVACKILNRNFIGFEISDKYYQIAVDRLNNTTQKEKRNKVKQEKLFEM